MIKHALILCLALIGSPFRRRMFPVNRRLPCYSRNPRNATVVSKRLWRTCRQPHSPSPTHGCSGKRSRTQKVAVLPKRLCRILICSRFPTLCWNAFVGGSKASRRQRGFGSADQGLGQANRKTPRASSGSTPRKHPVSQEECLGDCRSHCGTRLHHFSHCRGHRQRDIPSPRRTSWKPTPN